MTRSGAEPRKGSRSKARKRALDILFESEARGEDAQEVLARRIAGADAPPVSDFAASLVEGLALGGYRFTRATRPADGLERVDLSGATDEAALARGVGAAAAIAWVLFILIMLVSALQLRLFRYRDVD